MFTRFAKVGLTDSQLIRRTSTLTLLICKAVTTPPRNYKGKGDSSFQKDIKLWKVEGLLRSCLIVNRAIIPTSDS